MDHKADLVPQNIKDAIKDIGELSAIFYLYYHFSDKGWSVYKNIDEKGYDILLFHPKNRKRIKIEVKTRQRIISSAKNKSGPTHFTLSEIEKQSADYLVAFWLEHCCFFIVPTSKLKTSYSNDKKLYKFIASYNKKTGEPVGEAKKYFNNWTQIIK